MLTCITEPPSKPSQDTAYLMLEKDKFLVCVLNEHIHSFMCRCAVAVLYGSQDGSLYTDIRMQSCIISRVTCDLDPSSA